MMICVCGVMFCLRIFHCSETSVLSFSTSKSSRYVCMRLCMWLVDILFSGKVDFFLNFQWGDLLFCVGSPYIVDSIRLCNNLFNIVFHRNHCLQQNIYCNVCL